MNILIVGSGGREHALAWSSSRAPGVNKVFVAPGNAGTAMEPGIENVNIPVSDLDALQAFASENAVDLTIVGPEDPLVNGIVDRFNAAGLACFGPSAAAAQLEGSKVFAKDFMKKHGIPTAAYGSFTEVEPAVRFIRETGAPIVVKADGLAAGKGVIMAETTTQAEAAVLDMLAGNAFGEAGHRVVIEEFLVGEEASFIVMADGKNVLPLATSQDHKAVGDGDQGPNTGGMGAYSPAPVVDEAMHRRAMEEVILPHHRGHGVRRRAVYRFPLCRPDDCGPDGTPKVLEFNVRFGDPETQPILMRLQSSLPQHCLAAVQGELDSQAAVWDDRACLGVVMAAGGYPGSYEKGKVISGLDSDFPGHVKVFHAGTAEQDGQVVTSGGRVLCVCALGDKVSDAQADAYAACEQISWDGDFRRSDIGYRAIARE